MLKLWLVTAGCFLCLFVPVAAQPAELQPIISVNNTILFVNGTTAEPLDACTPADGHTIASGLARSANSDLLAFLSTDDAQTFVNTCVLHGDSPQPIPINGATSPSFSPTADEMALTYLDSAGEGVLAVFDARTLEERLTITPIELSDEGTIQPALWLPDGRLLTRSSNFDAFDSTTLEVVYVYEGDELITAPQISRLSTGSFVELFATLNTVLALYDTGALYQLDLAADEVAEEVVGELTTATAPLRLTHTVQTSIRGGVQRVWTVQDAAGGSTAFDFAGQTDQVALSPGFDEIIFLADDAAYRWQGGEAIAIDGTTTVESEAVTSVVWAPVMWSLVRE